MEKIKLSEYLDVCVGGDDVKNSKPDPEGFVIACERLETSLKSSIYIGDTVDDMLMAQNCDSQGGIGVTTGLSSLDQLSQHTERVFENLNQVADHLLKESQVV